MKKRFYTVSQVFLIRHVNEYSIRYKIYNTMEESQRSVFSAVKSAVATRNNNKTHPSFL